jgi:hypothetical protein
MSPTTRSKSASRDDATTPSPSHTTPSDLLRARILALAKTRSPKTICPSEVARALSQADLKSLSLTAWRDAMPLTRKVVFALRDVGMVEVLQRGEVLGRDVGVEEVRGPIRVRLAIGQESE